MHRRLSLLVGGFRVDVGLGEEDLDHSDVAFLHRQMKSVVRVFVHRVYVDPFVNQHWRERWRQVILKQTEQEIACGSFVLTVDTLVMNVKV